MAAEAYQGSFHFVNKNGSNLTFRDAEEAFSISSHVTNKYYQWAKKARNKHQIDSSRRSSRVRRARQTSNAEDSTTPDPSTPSTSGDSGHQTTYFNNKPMGKTICWQLASGTSTAHRVSTSPHGSPRLSSQLSEEDDSDEQYFRPELWPDGLIRPTSPTLPKRLDFNAPDWAACPRLQKDALRLFRSYFLSYSYAMDKRVVCPQDIEAAWHERATELVTDKKSLHGWFSGVLTFKALYLQPESFVVLYPMALRHQNRSLALLREYIREGGGPSESLLLCIWCIATAAFYYGNIEANLNHAPVMWDAVEKLGGIDALSPGTRAQVILADNGHSRFTLTRPRLHYSNFDPGAFDEQREFPQRGALFSDTDFSFQRWDEAFLLPDDALSDDLANYVFACREFMAAHTLVGRLQPEKDQDAASIINHWLHRRRMALSSWTMTLYCDIVDTITPSTRLSRKIRRELQACICLAMSYAMSFIHGFTLPLPKWLLYIPIQNLRPQVELLLAHMVERGTLLGHSGSSAATAISRPPLAVTHHEPLLFLFFTGACAEQISSDAGKRPELLADKRWHSTRFCEMTQILGLRTWKEAKKVLQRFLYGDGVVMDRFVEGLFELRAELVGKGGLIWVG